MYIPNIWTEAELAEMKAQGRKPLIVSYIRPRYLEPVVDYADEDVNHVVSKSVEALADLPFTVEITVYPYRTEFKVWEHSEYTDGSGKVYGSTLSEESPDRTDLNQLMHGEAKWDGCFNWMMRDQSKNCMSHACSLDDLLQLGELLRRLYTLGERCPHWNP